MLRIEQMEDDLYVIDLNFDETVKFHGVFRLVNIDETSLQTLEKGFKLELSLTDR